MKAAVSSIFFGEAAGAVVLPEQREEKRGDDRIHIDAKDIGRGARLVKRLHKLAVKGVEDVVIPAAGHELGDEALTWIVVHGLAAEDRVVNARQGPQLERTGLARLRLLLAVGIRQSREPWP